MGEVGGGAVSGACLIVLPTRLDSWLLCGEAEMLRGGLKSCSRDLTFDEEESGMVNPWKPWKTCITKWEADGKLFLGTGAGHRAGRCIEQGYRKVYVQNHFLDQQYTRLESPSKSRVDGS